MAFRPQGWRLLCVLKPPNWQNTKCQSPHISLLIMWGGGGAPGQGFATKLCQLSILGDLETQFKSRSLHVLTDLDSQCRWSGTLHRPLHYGSNLGTSSLGDSGGQNVYLSQDMTYTP